MVALGLPMGLSGGIKLIRAHHRPTAIATGEVGNHLVDSGKLEFRNRGGVLQPLAQGTGWIKQFKSNIVGVSPSLQKREHPHSPTSHGVYFRQIQDHYAGVCLRGYGVA